MSETAGGGATGIVRHVLFAAGPFQFLVAGDAMNSTRRSFRRWADASSPRPLFDRWQRMKSRRAMGFVIWLAAVAWAVIGWIPTTFLGLVGGTILAWPVWKSAIKHNDHVLWGALCIGLALIGLSSLLILVTGLVLRFRPEPSTSNPLSMETGSTFRTGYRLGLTGWNPLVRVQIVWQRPDAARCDVRYERGAFYEEVTADERAVVSEVVRKFVVRDVFGLARVRFRRRSPLDLKIEPHCGRAR